MSYHVHVLDPKMFKLWFAGQNYKEKRVEYVEDWCKEEDADLCFNLGIFGMSTGLGCSYVRAKGSDIAYGSEKPQILTIDANNKCRGYSDGIIDGQIKINLPMGGSNYRNGIGITTDGFYIIAQTSHMTTETVFCNTVRTKVREQGHEIKLFTLQDGGGSVSEYSALSNLRFNASIHRKVANVVCVKFRYKPTINHTLYLNCPYKDEVKLAQIALGGIEIDGSYGTGSKSRVTAYQKALGFPSPLQCGILGTQSLRNLGFIPNI